MPYRTTKIFFVLVFIFIGIIIAYKVYDMSLPPRYDPAAVVFLENIKKQYFNCNLSSKTKPVWQGRAYSSWKGLTWSGDRPKQLLSINFPYPINFNLEISDLQYLESICISAESKIKLTLANLPVLNKFEVYAQDSEINGLSSIQNIEHLALVGVNPNIIKDITELPNLKVLILKDIADLDLSLLKFIANSDCPLQELALINIGLTSIQDITANFALPQNLEKLDISNNHLESFDFSCLANFEKLHYLVFTRNDIDKLLNPNLKPDRLITDHYANRLPLNQLAKLQPNSAQQQHNVYFETLVLATGSSFSIPAADMDIGGVPSTVTVYQKKQPLFGTHIIANDGEYYVMEDNVITFLKAGEYYIGLNNESIQQELSKKSGISALTITGLIIIGK